MTVTNTTKHLLFFTALICSTAPSYASSEKSLPGFAYVNELLIQPPHLGNKSESKTCGISPNIITDIVLKKLKHNALPATSLLDAKNAKPEDVRVFIVPEVTTMDIQNFACVSYVSLTAKSQATLIIPPIKYPRNITVQYWSAGVMVSSSRAGHARSIETGFESLAQALAKTYRLAQPPVISLKPDKKLILD